MTDTVMNEQWGLSWSGKWHLIDVACSRVQPVSHCGHSLYRQADIQREGWPTQLVSMLSDTQTPICRRCAKAGGDK